MGPSSRKASARPKGLPPLAGRRTTSSSQTSLTATRGRQQAASHNAMPSQASRSESSVQALSVTPGQTPEQEGASKGAGGGGGVEKELTNNKLRLLQDIFEEADEDGGGGLDMDEFRNAMRKAMGDHLTDHDLDLTFMKVDTNCDGTVDWDEYLSYMLLEYREKDQMNFISQARPFPKELRSVPNMQRYQRNHDSVVKIDFMPNLTKTANNLYKPVDDGSGRYITASKDGVINFWNMELKHLRTNRVEPQKKCLIKNLGVWVTDLVCIPNLNLLAVATTACAITFYDLTVGKFSPIKHITELEIVATCLDYWYAEGKVEKAILLWGDARGNVCGVVFDDFKFLQPNISKKYESNVPFCKLLKGVEKSITAYRLPQIHNDFVLKVKYIQPLQTFLSCSKCGDTSLFHGDLHKKKASYFRVRQGIFSFDYCAKNNVIISGGKDTIVRVWNPYVHRKPVMLLQGHKTPVLYVKINEAKEHIISISEDKEINVFDMSTQTCIQTIYRKWVPLGTRPISAAFFNPVRQALLLGTNKLGIFEHALSKKSSRQSLTSHKRPVTVVLYNKLFNQVVSGGADSLVCIWDINTGERIMQFTAHKVHKRAGEDICVEITAMKFDPTLRRLLTAAQDGTIRIWNFNNGALLRELEIFENKEVTGLIWYNQRILAAGWNRQITVYVDAADDESVHQWRRQHKEDIHALAHLSPGTVASASYDGDVMIWSVETGLVVNKLNASVSAKPIPQTYSLAAMGGKRVRESLGPLPPIVNSTRASSPGSVSANCGEPDSLVNGNDTRGSFNARQRFMLIKSGLSAMSRFQKHGKMALPPIPKTAPKTDSTGMFKLERSPEAAVEKLLFLQTRPTNKDQANLVCVDANGWIRFWSIHPEGGLLGQYNAAHVPSDGILTVTTDPDNLFLFTGDTRGYLKTWDISEYCRGGGPPHSASSKKKSMFEHFPILHESPLLQRKANTRQELFQPPSDTTDPDRTWKAPPLLNSFRAHLQTVSYIEYIPDREQLITCSTDCSIRLWTVYGSFIGIFNHEVPWGSVRPEVAATPSPCKVTGRVPKRRFGRLKEEMATMRLPPDVRRVASATTLRVFYGGHRSHWKLAKNIVMIWIPMLRMRRDTPREEEGQAERPDSQALPQSPARATPSPKPLAVEGSGDWEALEKEGRERKDKKSILGSKTKVNRKHHQLPPLKKIRQFHHQYDVYSSLPFFELEQVPTLNQLKPPQCILDIRERQKLMAPHKAAFRAGGRRVRTLVRMSFAGKPRGMKLMGQGKRQGSLLAK